MDPTRKWAEVKLGELINTQKGFAFKSAWYCDDGHPIVKVSDFTQNSIDADSLTKIPEEIAEKYIRYSLREGDVVIQTVGSWPSNPASVVGKCIRTPRSANMALLNQNAVRLDPNNKIEKSFLYYALKSPKFSSYIVGTAQGAASQAAITLEAIREHEMKLPPLPTQRKIAAILSAYDDLIENNLRRIKILEGMAQNLYREWFVKFRFPGHERARFVDSALGRIPEGWEISVLGEHLVELESGKRPKGGAQDISNGIPSVGAENIMRIGRHNYQNEKFVSHDFFEGMRKGIVKDGDVAIYKDGAYIGKSSYFRDNFPHEQFCVNEHVFLLRSTGKRLTQNSLYLWLNESDTVSAIRATNANAAQPGINQSGVNGLSLIVPTLDIANCFDQLTDPILALLISLAKKNENIRRTRDLLLSKLISGEVDVSELDITIPEEVVQ